MRVLRWAVACAVPAAAAVVASGCSNAEHTGGTPDGAAGRSGAAASAGAGTSRGGGAAEGTGGGAPVNGAGGTSGTADGGASSAAGEAGQGGSAGAGASSVLDPKLPVPSRDCRAEDSESCLSIAGTYEGKPVDEVVDTETCGSGGVKSGKWGIGCNHIGALGQAVLDVPIARPGAFTFALTPANAGTLDFQYVPATGNGVVALFAGNFVRAEVQGTVVVTPPGSEYRVVSGTFHGVWSAPDSSCKSLAGGACASAELNVTFRLTTRFGSCFSDSECTPPLTCDMVGFACFNR